MKQRLDKLRDILNQYKVFMEFFSMICVSIMSIMVGITANIMSKEQLLLTEKQLKAEYAPRFELVDKDSDNRVDMWIRNYKIKSFSYVNYYLKVNPFEDFSDGILKDYYFEEIFARYEDWSIIEEYLGGNHNLDLNRAFDIKRDFEKMFNNVGNNYRRFENSGGEINNVTLQPFVLCTILKNGMETSASFIINDFYETVQKKYENHMFELYFRDYEVLYDAIQDFTYHLKNKYGADYSVKITTALYITYHDSIDNQISEYYVFNSGGTSLTRADLDSYINQCMSPSPNSKIDLGNFMTFYDTTFEFGDLYDQDSRIIDAMSQLNSMH